MAKIVYSFIFAVCMAAGTVVFAQEAPSAAPAAVEPAAPETVTAAPPADEPVAAEPAAAAPSEPAPKAKPATAAATKPAVKDPVNKERSVSKEQAARLWEFLKANGKDQREEVMDATLFQLSQFLRMNSDWDFSDEALLLQSDLLIRRGDHKAAVIALLDLIYEYPDSRFVFQAKRTLAEVRDKKIDKKLKPLLSEAAKGPEAGEKSDRLAQLLKRLSEQTGDALHEQLVLKFDQFFLRYPSYAKADELHLLLGDLHAKKGKHLTALTYYQRLLKLYPESGFRARAQRTVGDIYISNLKDVDKGVNAYQEVINQYPQSGEAAYAYEQTAKIEENLKHFNLSLELYDKIIELYPNDDAAMRAFNHKARIFRDQMNTPRDAVAAYNKLADMFKGSDGAAEALKAAAATARKMKDYETEVSMYARFVRDCSANAEAPEILYAAAQVTEEDLKQRNRAVELYTELVEKYPASKLVKKAKGRVQSLTK